MTVSSFNGGKEMNNTDKHLIACNDPFHSVVSSFDVVNGMDTYLLGVKNDNHIPSSFVRRLEKTGKYALHTIDHMSASGRDIDLQLVNPLTGRWMTGSSSGTAVNVFLGINDVGIGTDGGGSVLAPAMSLNLFSFMSPILENEHMIQFNKTSTDGIVFHPSLGFITSKKSVLEEIIRDCFELPEYTKNLKIAVSTEDTHAYPFVTEAIKYPDIYGNRQIGIEFLTKALEQYDVVISFEGPVDLVQYGDTVYGHFDKKTQNMQRQSGKGLLRVVNMVSATAITIPSDKLGFGFVLITKSKLENIAGLIVIMNEIPWEEDILVKDYFRNIQTWTRKGFGF